METVKRPYKRRFYTLDGLTALAPDTLLTVDMLAKVIGVDSKTVRRMVDRCDLPQPFKMGKTGYFKAGSIQALLNEKVARAEQETRRRLKKIREFA